MRTLSRRSWRSCSMIMFHALCVTSLTSTTRMTSPLTQQNNIKNLSWKDNSLTSKELYIEVPRPDLTPQQQKNIVKTRWVIMDRLDSTSVSEDILKTRFVANGYNQLVTSDTSAATPASTSLRCLLLMSTVSDWDIWVFGEGVKSARGETAILGRGDHTQNMFGTSLHTAYCRQTMHSKQQK